MGIDDSLSIAVYRMKSKNGTYLRITDTVVDYFICFHSGHIVPIHLIGRHIEYRVFTLMPGTTLAQAGRYDEPAALVVFPKLSSTHSDTTVVLRKVQEIIIITNRNRLILPMQCVRRNAAKNNCIQTVRKYAHTRAHSNTHWLEAASRRHDRS